MPPSGSGSAGSDHGRHLHYPDPVFNYRELPPAPGVFARVFEEALGLRQAIAGGFGAVLMNGVKRGLFSNEAGSGSAPCAAATAETSHPAKVGLMQAMGVFIDTLLCTCTAMIMLLVPADKSPVWRAWICCRRQ